MADRLEPFAPLLLAWFDKHGRHDLPWQRDINPYRVWVSEIMLQQTQVATVIDYYQRFMARFPDVSSLAAATEDEVLHYWSGLGYYARGRNLLRAARRVVSEWGGEFPGDANELMQLPGIGRSTAGAISSIALRRREPILDGNVKRVLCRVEAIDSSPYDKATNDRLWSLAEQLTPEQRVADYTQAIMDLGATVCTRSKPLCDQCPMQNLCTAHAQGRPKDYPVPKARKRIPTRQCQMLIIRNAQGETLLEKRPGIGVWGGLWSFPQITPEELPMPACEKIVSSPILSMAEGTAFRHTFSHYHLQIQPVFIHVQSGAPHVLDSDTLLWHTPGQRDIGLAAPVKKLLAQPGPPQLALSMEGE